MSIINDDYERLDTYYVDDFEKIQDLMKSYFSQIALYNKMHSQIYF